MKWLVAGIGVFAAFYLAAASPADARGVRPAANYDGPWRLSFVTRAGACAPSYDFDVNIARGRITHPNLVRFRGSVSRRGFAQASVIVQDKSATGSGRLSGTSGQGSWRGFSGRERCSGYWTASKI